MKRDVFCLIAVLIVALICSAVGFGLGRYGFPACPVLECPRCPVVPPCPEIPACPNCECPEFPTPGPTDTPTPTMTPTNTPTATRTPTATDVPRPTSTPQPRPYEPAPTLMPDAEVEFYLGADMMCQFANSVVNRFTSGAYSMGDCQTIVDEAKGDDWYRRDDLRKTATPNLSITPGNSG